MIVVIIFSQARGLKRLYWRKMKYLATKVVINFNRYTVFATQ